MKPSGVLGPDSLGIEPAGEEGSRQQSHRGGKKVGLRGAVQGDHLHKGDARSVLSPIRVHLQVAHYGRRPSSAETELAEKIHILASCCSVPPLRDSEQKLQRRDGEAHAAGAID
jgi:hypothetical protein